MWKAGDQADTNVDSAYCRGTTVLRRVALKSGRCRALCVHSEGLARTANQGTRRDVATDANREACPTFLLWRRYGTSELSQRPFRPEGLAVPISNAALGFEPVLEVVPVLGASRQEQLVCEACDIGIRNRGLANRSVASRFNRP